MKKILLSLMAFAVFGFTAKLNAQCDIIQTNVIVQVVGTPVSLGPNKCEYTLNVEFDMTSNAGFKYLFFHSWLAADYPATPIFNCAQSNAQDPGTAAQLGTAVDQIGKSFLDYGFIDITPTTGIGIPQTLTFATTYPHDGTVILTEPTNSPGLSATRTETSTGVYHFDITNMKVIVNQSCGSALSVKSDIWGTNSNAPDPKAQCYICASPGFLNDPSIAGFKICSNPRSYNLGISTIDPTSKDITYKVYIDMDGNGALDFGTDELAFTSGTIAISSSSPYSVTGAVLPAPYSTQQPYSNKGYLILVEGAALTNSVLAYFADPSCSPLPVHFTSFTAKRNNASSVGLVWQTAFELNNSGFEVQRNVNGNWETVAFIPTQAAGGNSDALLTYNFTDMNNAKGMSQYRIRQIDFDGKSEFSVVRAVRGEGVSIKTVIYPNPSFDGRVNVVFEDASGIRDIVLMDMSGRMVRNWTGVSNNNLLIDNLNPGMYSLKIIVRETGAQTVEKLVVNKR